MKALTPNTLIQNRYLIVQLIGKGGMGEVYLAVDQRLGSAVALKRTYFADDLTLGGAFEREAKILARLRHPVLPKVSDHFSENGEQYLVMEHISGDDLSKRLEAAQKPFPSSWVLFWADQLLDALSYLHSHEPPIIHRDIKPQNLKLTDENHIVLLDFGLSKNSTGQTNVTTGSRSSGSVVGYTPHYAPMEQIRGTGTDPRSDLYSLSATLYQLMTDVVPVDALSRADALLSGQPDPIQQISDLSPEISPDVSAVILKGMEVSQDKRWATAREMQKALRKAYTAMQEAMAAKTMVYNSSSEPAVEIPSSAVEPLPYAPASGDTVPSTPIEVSHQSVTPLPDATVQYDAPADPQPQVRQADVKTEVYRADQSPLISAGYESSPIPVEATPATSYSEEPAAAPVEDDWAKTQHYSGDAGFSPDATVPIISVGETGAQAEPGSPEFFTTPNIATGQDTFSTSSATASAAGTGSTSASVSSVATTAKPKPAPAKKKGGSGAKIGIALGVLGLLFILGLGGAVGGWYVYNNYYSATPTPEPSLEESPTPAPTIEATMTPESNSNSGIDVNGNTSSNNSNSGSLIASPTPEPTATPAATQTPTQRPTPERDITPQTRPTRVPSTPKPTQPPKTRPTPMILQ